jgi:hypothetical protein
MKVPKKDGASIRKLRGRIRQFARLGLNQYEMTRVLRREGFKSPDGGPLKPSMVAAIGKLQRVVPPVFPTKPETPKKVERVARMILDSDLTDAKKLSIVRRLRALEL